MFERIRDVFKCCYDQYKQKGETADILRFIFFSTEGQKMLCFIFFPGRVEKVGACGRRRELRSKELKKRVEKEEEGDSSLLYG